MTIISVNNLATFVTKMTKPDALAPVIGLETTVTGGRTIQAYKRGGDDEARERFIEESIGAIVWLAGVKVLNDYVGDPILKKLFGGSFDVGSDKILRTPFENFMKKQPPKGYSAKSVAIIKAIKVLASVLIADAFIGLVVPPLNQKLTRTLITKKREEAKQSQIDNNKDINDKKTAPAFKGSGSLAAINVFTNAIENTNTGKLLSTDAGLVSGRMYSARNNEERREIAIRDIGSIYFYMWAQGHTMNLINLITTGKATRLNSNTAISLDKYLQEFITAHGGEMSVEEFRKAMLGKKISEIELPKDITFETAKLSSFTQFMDKFRKVKTEPLQVAKVSELESVITDKALMDRIREMSKLQPLRQGEAVITKQQIIDSINVAGINDPKFLDRIFNEFTGGKYDDKGKCIKKGASSDEYKFVSNKKLYALKAEMEDYINSLCKLAKDGKINKEVISKAKDKNIIFNTVNFVAGFATAAVFLSTVIPKIQYWVTKKATGKDSFPGVYEYENNDEQTKLALSA